MATIKNFIGFIPEEGFDSQGLVYLKETTNPSAMMAVYGNLVIKKGNESFTLEEINRVHSGMSYYLNQQKDGN